MLKGQEKDQDLKEIGGHHARECRPKDGVMRARTRSVNICTIIGRASIGGRVMRQGEVRRQVVQVLDLGLRNPQPRGPGLEERETSNRGFRVRREQAL